MSDLELEEGFRSAIGSAVIEFKREFETQAAAEEEGHVASLLTRIETRIKLHSADRAAAGIASTPVQLIGEYRRVPKHEEHDVNADVALTITVGLPALRATFADFVQVKKSRLRASTRDADSWTIDNDQLTALLKLSATAVYWMIALDGSVLAVPAKYLHALANGKGSADQGTFTAYYSDIRHCAISLQSYLVDLLTGTWLGSSSDHLLSLARGDNGRTRPFHLFELSIEQTSQ